MAPDENAMPLELERVARQLAREALEQAAGRARAILVERLTDTLVAEAERSLTAPASNAPAAAPAEPARAPGPGVDVPERVAGDSGPVADARERTSGCYLFAITQAGGAPFPSLPGMDGAGSVREVVSGRLAAIVCEIPLELFDGLEQEPVGPGSRLAELAARHDEVVRATFERRVVLPLRFGTVLTSERQLVGVLEVEQARLLAELQRLEGKAEWTCRIQPDPAAATAAARQAPVVEGGAEYLVQRERQLAATAEGDPYGVDAAAERVTREVEAYVESALPHEPAGDESRVSYLVPDEGQERFADAVVAVAEGLPTLRIELLGPHPPYHFATVQLGQDGR